MPVPPRRAIGRRDDAAIGSARVVTRAAREARLHRFPLPIGDDPPSVVVLTHPLGLGTFEALPPARLVILHPLGPVPHVLAAVDRIEKQRAQPRRRPALPSR